VIIEDIVDSGNTIEKLVELIGKDKPASVKIATLLFKPRAYQKTIPVDYVAIEVGNEFLVGYGLDYDGLGRNLKDIYIITE
jgi:hypoxanthine phosphoribosyltransferase